MTTPAQEAEFWNGCASDPDLSRKWLCGEPELTQATVELIRSYLPDDAAYVVDLGCGDGRLARQLPQFIGFPIVIGVDVSHKIRMAADAENDRNHVRSVVVLDCPGRSLPAHLHDLDGAYSVAMFQHLPPDAVSSYYESVARALKPGGVFVAQFVQGDKHEDFDHKYDWDTLTELVMGEGTGWYSLEFFSGAIQDEWLWVIARTIPEELKP